MPGLRVELEIDAPQGCPVVAAAEDVGGTATDVTWGGDDRTIEQFDLGRAEPGALEGTAPAAGAPSASEPGGGTAPAEGATAFEPVFEHEEGIVYEFERSEGPCACERIERSGHPIADVRAEDGSLFVVLHMDGTEDVGGLLRDLEAVSEAVRIRGVTRAGPGDDPDDLVAVDRGQLTDRQREVLETAHAMGYFEYPRGANASEVAEALDICPSTLAEHLAAAQTKLLGDLLDGDPGVVGSGEPEPGGPAADAD